RLAERIKQGERVDHEIYDTDTFEERIAKLQTKDVPENLSRLHALFVLLDLITHSEEQELRAMIHHRSFDEPVQEALKLLNVPALMKVDEDESDAPADPDLAAQQREREELLKLLSNTFDTEKSKTSQREEARKVIDELRKKDGYRDWVRRVFAAFQYELMTLSLTQTRARLDAMTLPPISITQEEAFRTASENRLDWMNRKAQLVDTWRQMDVAADKLKGVFDIKLNGKLGNIDKRGVRFDSDTGSLDVQFEWDTPLNRYNEMMTYRASQIDYQRARRNYYTYVDSVQSVLRNTLRDVQMSQINFEIRRNEVFAGTTRVDVMQLRMDQPPQRGAKIDTNTAEQLISALNGLTASQNNFLETWVTYQTRRMLLDLYMGTMSLDEQGRWIEPTTMGTQTSGSPVVVTPTLPMPTLETPKRNRRYVEPENDD
ncbi:MAG: hypothetical protein LBI05_01495, partial [Planctomycetaceae bacterium]|nr:hypothetical protein [Planctomycetaceae bacterium]